MCEDIKNKTCTLYSLFQKYSHLLIPSLQRAYAQGRQTADATEVRKKFLADIHKVLKDEKTLSLDLIYGEKEGEDFILLDGQQRLTTLYLIHCYFAGVSDSDISWIRIGEQAEFCYKTRDSSSDFCSMLVKPEILSGFAGLDKTSSAVSDYLKDSCLFQWSWNFDPTIQSMLTMLDAIHVEFKEHEKGWFKEKYADLTDEGKQVISFQLYELKNTLTSEELYIRMNQRGLKLTDYENFKASFLGFFHQKKIAGSEAQNVDLTKFSHNLDNAWIDYFWKRGKDEKTTDVTDAALFDTQLMLLLRACIEFFYITTEMCLENSGRGKKDSLLEAITNRKEKLTFFKLEDLGFFDIEEDIWQVLRDFQSIMELLLRIQKMPSSGVYKAVLDSLGSVLSLSSQKDSFSRDAQICCFATFYYCLRLREKMTEEEFEIYYPQWQKIITNIVKWSDYAHQDQMINAINTINEFLKQEIKDFAGFIKVNPKCHHNENSTGLHLTQWYEEYIKENLRQISGWEDKINEAEEYFGGQIILLLEYAGIYSAENTGKIDFTAISENHLKDFNYYRESLKSFFNLWEKSAVPRKALAIENLLAFPDEVIYPARREAPWDFNISPKTGPELKIDISRKTNQPFRKLLKSLLDKLRNEEGAFDEAISRYVETNRFYICAAEIPYGGFIISETVSDFTGEKMLNRYDSDKEAIYLIPKEKSYLRNGFREYHLYLLAEKLETQHLAFEWEDGSLDDRKLPSLNLMLSSEIRITYEHKFICKENGKITTEGNMEKIMEYLISQKTSPVEQNGNGN